MSFVVAAYVLLWVGFFAYLLHLSSRLATLRREARALSGTSLEDDPAGVSTHPLEPPPS